MAEMRSILQDMLEIHAQEVESGGCACQAFPMVAGQEGFMDVTQALIDTLAGLLTVAEMSGMSQEQITASVGHFLTLVLAVGYVTGSQDAYDVSLMTDVLVPDDIAEMFGEFVETWERPEDN